MEVRQRWGTERAPRSERGGTGKALADTAAVSPTVATGIGSAPGGAAWCSPRSRRASGAGFPRGKRCLEAAQGEDGGEAEEEGGLEAEVKGAGGGTKAAGTKVAAAAAVLPLPADEEVTS